MIMILLDSKTYEAVMSESLKMGTMGKHFLTLFNTFKLFTSEIFCYSDHTGRENQIRMTNVESARERTNKELKSRAESAPTPPPKS